MALQQQSRYGATAVEPPTGDRQRESSHDQDVCAGRRRGAWSFRAGRPALAVPVTFESVGVIDCDGDTGFSLTITLDDRAIAPNGSDDTRSDGGAGFLGWAASSDVGGGFSIAG